MTILAPKRPTEVRQYVFDFSLSLGEDEIQAYQIAVTSGAVTSQSDQQCGPRAISALLQGGVDGQTSTFEIQVTSAAGQLVIRDFSLLTSNTASTAFNSPSTSTKGQLQDMAFEECSLAGYAFDATPAEQASSLRRLDSLMALWAQQGLDIGYNFPAAFGGSTRNDPSGFPDFAIDAVVVKLALSMAPGIGKTLSAESRLRMAESLRAVRAAFAVIPRMRLPGTTARGAGGKPWSTWRPFMGCWGGETENPIASGMLGIEGGGVIGTEDGDIIGV